MFSPTDFTVRIRPKMVRKWYLFRRSPHPISHSLQSKCRLCPPTHLRRSRCSLCLLRTCVFSSFLFVYVRASGVTVSSGFNGPFISSQVHPVRVHVSYPGVFVVVGQDVHFRSFNDVDSDTKQGQVLLFRRAKVIRLVPFRADFIMWWNTVSRTWLRVLRYYELIRRTDREVGMSVFVSCLIA